MVTAIAVSIPAAATPAASPEVSWTRQVGTTGFDRGVAVASAATATYVGGETEGSLAGTSNGLTDAVLRRYRPDGSTAWTRQLGTNGGDGISGVAIGGGAVYAAGNAGGEFPGQTAAGNGDGFVARYSSDGTRQWLHQFGSPSIDFVNAVAASANAVYVGGTTQGVIPGGLSAGGAGDAFIRKYNAAGDTIEWTVQLGTSTTDSVEGLVVTDTALYAAGYTGGPLGGEVNPGGSDAFLQRYNLAGELQWTRVFGTPADERATSLAGDGQRLYVGGRTAGSLTTSWGGDDAFVRTFSPSGAAGWTRQFGTGADDYLWSVSANAGSVYAAGHTFGAFPGSTDQAGSDLFAARIDRSGDTVWVRQAGSSGADFAEAVAAGPSGVYVAGFTDGALTGTSKGGYDMVVRRLVSYRPDGWISHGSLSGAVGNDIYNAGSSNQTASTSTRRGGRATFYVRAQNDGDAADTLAVDGCASSGGFVVRYFRGPSGDTEITGKVVDGTYRIRGIGPATNATLRMVIRVTDRAKIGSAKFCALTLSSVLRPSRVDTVRGRVEARR